MQLGPADKDACCAECADIAREFNEAYADACLRNEAASDALRDLIGGTEQLAERADELLRPYRYQTNPGFQDLPPRLVEAMHRTVLHALRTGHFTKYGYK